MKYVESSFLNKAAEKIIEKEFFEDYQIRACVGVNPADKEKLYRVLLKVQINNTMMYINSTNHTNLEDSIKDSITQIKEECEKFTYIEKDWDRYLIKFLFNQMQVKYLFENGQTKFVEYERIINIIEEILLTTDTKEQALIKCHEINLDEIT